MEPSEYWRERCCSTRLMYISRANSLDHCTQGATGDGGDTPPSLGRCSIIDKVDTICILTVSSELTDWGGKGVPVLEMLDQVGDLSPFHAVAAPIEAVAGRRESIADMVELHSELGLLVV